MKHCTRLAIALFTATVASVPSWAQDNVDPHLKLRLTFDTVEGTGATLVNGATLSTEGTMPTLDLGMENGYLDLGDTFGATVSQLTDFTVSTYLFLPTTGTLGQNGNFIFSFANSNNMAADKNGCMFLNARDTRYAITTTNYTAEQGVNMTRQFTTEEWKHVAYVQDGTTGYIYIDGQLAKQGTVSITPSQLGATMYNYLGRPCYSGDSYLKGARYSDFRVYDAALDEAGVAALADSLGVLNALIYNRQLTAAAEGLTLEDLQALNHDLLLPLTATGGVTVQWSSSDQNLITPTGHITRPAQGQPDGHATLTATLTKGTQSIEKTFDVTVMAQMDAQGCLAYDLQNIALRGGNIDNLRSNLLLPTVTAEGSILNWKSSDTSYLTDGGRLARLAPKGENVQVTLTATAYKDSVTATRDFTITIGQDEGNSCYLFTYFTGNAPSQEQICYALSMDGYNYTPLNNGDPIIASDTIAIKKSVRDPHILRGEDGKTFYMVVTDMKSEEGWSSNDGMVLMKSTDLVNWTHTAIDFPTAWPDRFDRDDLTRVWAPQTIYDPAAGKYMVYYSIKQKSRPQDIVYYSYANDDFTQLTEPQVLFDLGSNTIDADIVYSDSLYHMFFKTEDNGNGIQKATAPTLQGPWTPIRQYLQQTNVAVEGSGVFKLINSDQWVLMYDCYTSGYYQFCTSSDLQNFTYVCNAATSGKFTPRHGTVIAITADEAQRLVERWPSTALKNAPIGSNNPYARVDHMEVNTTARTVTLPVYYGADLSHFDPMLYGFAGTTVSPEGEQDFTAGAVKYTFSMPGKTDVTYRVNVQLAVNPILPGFHADPEILYSRKTGKFYCYTTTDGFAGWGGTYFQCYSSPNLVEWTLEGTVLDLATSQVAWATGNAWAPAIEEKEVDGQYRYYFYYSGNAGPNKQIGVATASTPVGPFTDHGSSIIDTSPTGSGQQIDVDVFTDPVSGRSYIYWGNGYMAGAELEDDMATLVPGTTKVLTPSGGTLSTYAYREAPYVFYRNGLYYFMWSVDDTGSANYHVAYGTSTSPLGPITVASSPIVIIQDSKSKIYGTAHNSVLQIPGRDEWYIVYHRINKNYINNSPGVHRETCIDRLYFNADGTIQRVTPTHAGVEPFDAFAFYTPVCPPSASATDPAVSTVRYYTPDGICVGTSLPATHRGLYIKREQLSDGTLRATKCVKR